VPPNPSIDGFELFLLHPCFHLFMLQLQNERMQDTWQERHMFLVQASLPQSFGLSISHPEIVLLSSVDAQVFLFAGLQILSCHCENPCFPMASARILCDLRNGWLGIRPVATTKNMFHEDPCQSLSSRPVLFYTPAGSDTNYGAYEAAPRATAFSAKPVCKTEQNE
jgi:hypothetical protein